jgi:hypothetical protein
MRHPLKSSSDQKDDGQACGLSADLSAKLRFGPAAQATIPAAKLIRGQIAHR